MQHFLHGSLSDPFKRLKLQLSKLLKSRKKGTDLFFPYFIEIFCEQRKNKSVPFFSDGGARRDRTADLLLAKQVLSQLSYGPLLNWWVWEELNFRPHPYQGCALTN